MGRVKSNKVHDQMLTELKIKILFDKLKEYIQNATGATFIGEGNLQYWFKKPDIKVSIDNNIISIHPWNGETIKLIDRSNRSPSYRLMGRWHLLCQL